MILDMNQDGYFEEALKLRNLLEEFSSSNQVGQGQGQEEEEVVVRRRVVGGSGRSLSSASLSISSRNRPVL